VLAALVCARLGFWQLSRLEARRAANRAVLAARDLPPVSLDEAGSRTAFEAAPTADRRVEVTGRYDHAAEFVLRDQSEGGVPGVKVVTPLLPLGTDTGILVIRGYVPSPDAMTVELDSLREPGVHTVRGYAVLIPSTPDRGAPAERQGRLTLRRLDRAAIEERLPYPIRRYAIAQAPDTGLPAWPRRLPPPALTDGPHLSYAVQWFSFAAMALIVGSAVGLKERKRSAPRPPRLPGKLGGSSPPPAS
jgi:surfeit locus 1 family protein